VTCCAYSLGGNVIAFGSLSSTPFLWNIADRTCAVLDEGAGTVKCCAFSPDGTLLAGGESGGQVWI
jgi:WD40 repeat protein